MSKVKLGDYIDSYGDGIHGTPIYDDNGEYYFINGNNLINGEIYIDKNTLRISEKEYKRIKRNLGTNTLLLSINGTLGRIAEYKGEKIALGKSACYLNIKLGENKYFVKYIMSTKEFQKYILLVAHGSTIKNLAPSQVVDYEFELPEKIEPNKIASLLKTIDDKINNNNKINAELEAMAKTLYDYWFLQFEFPNEEGKPYKSSGGKMVWNEELKRKIPVGWDDGIIGDLGEIVAGGTPSTKNEDYYTEEGIAWITPNDLSNTNNKYISHGERDITEEGLKNSSAKLMPQGTILLTSRAPIGYIGVALNEICTNQGFKSIIPYKNYGTEFVYYTIQTMIPYIKSLGSGSTFTEVSKDIVEKIKVILPDTKIISKYNVMMNPMAESRKNLEKENQELEELRDFLLPLLMNGQVGFKEN